MKKFSLHRYLKNISPIKYTDEGIFDSKSPIKELGDVPVQIYRGDLEPKTKTTGQKAKEFVLDHKLEIATGVYLLAAAIQYHNLYQDPIFGEMLRHNSPQTTVNSRLPWIVEKIKGNWMPPRRDLTLGEFPVGHATVALSPLFEKYVVKNASSIVNEAKKITHPLKRGNLNELGKEIKRFVYECAGR